ncbi:MAG TPA: hypothetical protein VGD24_09155 [Gallionella sp.]
MVFLLLIVGVKLSDMNFVNRDANLDNLAQKKWNEFQVLDALAKADRICEGKANILHCDQLASWKEDVRTSLVSCKKDVSSSLCADLLRAESDERYRHLFQNIKNVQPVELTHNPFYLTLPTKYLSDNASDFGYRKEIFSRLYRQWKTVIYICIAAATAIFLLIKLVMPLTQVQNPQEVVEPIALKEDGANRSNHSVEDKIRLTMFPYLVLEGEEAEEQFAREKAERDERKVKQEIRAQKVLNLTAHEKAAFEQLKNNIRMTLSP